MNILSLSFFGLQILEDYELVPGSFSHLKAYILLINSWLYVQFKVHRINYLTEKETNWFPPAARAYRFHQKIENKLGDRMIKQLLNLGYRKISWLSVSRRSIICLSLRLRQIIDRLATDKSRYFAQPRPIIVKSPSPKMWKIIRQGSKIRFRSYSNVVDSLGYDKN